MKVLVACEFSGIVREAFAKRGHDAWSCDLLPTEIPGKHIQDDVLKHLNEGWDLMIAHPPCTYLCVPGAHYLHTRPSRWGLMWEARKFFLCLLNADILLKAIENPLPHRYADLPKYSQIIQPWQFGHELSKRTCLWLRGLEKLKPTDIRENHGERYIRTPRQQKKYGKVSNAKWYAQADAKERSRTFQGIANAMAEQWGDL
jgi:hypothetical protein